MKRWKVADEFLSPKGILKYSKLPKGVYMAGLEQIKLRENCCTCQMVVECANWDEGPVRNS